MFPPKFKLNDAGMDEHKFTQLLRSKSAEVSGKSRFCPEDQLIARYFGGSLSDRERAGLKHHLAGCRFCLARIGNLARLDSSDHGQEVPEFILAEAKRLAKSSAPLRTWSTPAWATAATVILAVAFTLNWKSPNPVESAPVTARPDLAVQDVVGRQSRNSDPRAMAPHILAPQEGARINPEAFIIRWSEIQGTLYYDVRIVSDDGGLLRQERVEGTQWSLPPELELASGREYYVRVDAYLAEAKSLSSRHVVFIVEEQHCIEPYPHHTCHIRAECDIGHASTACPTGGHGPPPVGR